MPGASVIVIATRWHHDDIIGRLILEQGDRWEVISMPAVHDGNMNAVDVDHPDAVSLWPDLYTMDHMRNVRKSVTSYTWSALYQGNPVPQGAAVFESTPSRFRLQDFKLDGHRLCIAVDPAATANTKADYSCALVCAMKGYGADAEMWVLDRLKCQVTIPELIRRLHEMQKTWRAPMAIEAVGAFKVIPDTLREMNNKLDLLPVQLKGDKFTRAQPYAGCWNDGRVYIPTDAYWAEDFIHEHSIFTGIGDVHDDQVDAGAHGFTAMFRAYPPQRRTLRPDFMPLG